MQATDELTRLYHEEPDEGYWPWLEDREAEIFGPLLIHAKLIGPDAERDLVEVVKRFSQAKSEIEAEDSNTAKAIAVLECLQKMQSTPDAKFAPMNLLDALLEHEAWGPTFEKVKGTDDKTRRKAMAVKIGYFLTSFRLPKEKGAHRIEYDLQNAIDVIRRHVPQKPSEPSEPSAAENTGRATHEDSNTSDSAEGADSSADSIGRASTQDSSASDSSDTSDSFAGGDGNISSEPENHRQNNPADAAATANDAPQDHSMTDTEADDQTSSPFRSSSDGSNDSDDPFPTCEGVDPSSRESEITDTATERDYLFDAVVARCRETGQVAVSDLMATFGMSRAQAIGFIDQMERLGLVGPAKDNGPRPFLPGPGQELAKG